MQRGCTFKCTLIKGAMLSFENFVHYTAFCFIVIISIKCVVKHAFLVCVILS
nr:MAG TPA: hypothetical protein [Caudoviricetes sp.]